MKGGFYLFIEPYFFWRNKSCTDYNLSIIDTNTDVINDIGIPFTKNITKDDSSKMAIFNEEEGEAEEFTLSLCLTDKYHNPLTWTNEIFKEISKWLVTDSFEEFRAYDNPDYIYYLKVTKIQKRFTFYREGWIDVTFKPFSNYAYKRVIKKESVNGEKIINIYNESDKTYEPLIILTWFGAKNGIIQINDFMMQGIEEGTTVYIDNCLTNIKDSNNNNLLYTCNRMWVILEPGENQIFLSGTFDIEVICEFPEII